MNYKTLCTRYNLYREWYDTLHGNPEMTDLCKWVYWQIVRIVHELKIIERSVARYNKRCMYGNYVSKL